MHPHYKRQIFPLPHNLPSRPPPPCSIPWAHLENHWNKVATAQLTGRQKGCSVPVQSAKSPGRQHRASSPIRADRNGMRTEPTISFGAAARRNGCAATAPACCFGAAPALLLQPHGGAQQRPCRLNLRRSRCRCPCAPAARVAAAAASLAQAPAADIAADAGSQLSCALGGEYEVDQ